MISARGQRSGSLDLDFSMSTVAGAYQIGFRSERRHQWYIILWVAGVGSVYWGARQPQLGDLGPIDHVTANSLPSSLPTTRMGKRKKRFDTLTKIDPSTLRPKPLAAVSQHAIDDKTRVTTSIRPVLPRPTPTPPEAPIFDADPLNFAEEYPSDGENAEDVSEGYLSAKVRSFHVPSSPQL